jgi:hypothetical protein
VYSPPATSWALGIRGNHVFCRVGEHNFNARPAYQSGTRNAYSLGLPFAIIVGGILMPFATKGRLGLEVRTHGKTFRWKPPLVVDKTSKQKIQATFDQIAAACEKSGLRVTRS